MNKTRISKLTHLAAANEKAIQLVFHELDICSKRILRVTNFTVQLPFQGIRLMKLCQYNHLKHLGSTRNLRTNSRDNDTKQSRSQFQSHENKKQKKRHNPTLQIPRLNSNACAGSQPRFAQLTTMANAAAPKSPLRLHDSCPPWPSSSLPASSFTLARSDSVSSFAFPLPRFELTAASRWPLTTKVVMVVVVVEV